MGIWNADLGNGCYRNPVLYADYSDPDAIRVGEDYFMTASSFCNAPGLPILHSKDLVNWQVVNYALDKLPADRYDKPIHGCGVWAPAIRYHEGLYYIYFPMSDEGIYVTTATNPFGKWSEPVNIRPGAGWIDPCPFWDEDGRAYLVAGVAKSRIGYNSVLHVVEMSADGMRLIGDEVKVFDGNNNGQKTIEGPKMYKRNGWYYIFAPAGGVKPGWQTVLRSRNVFGPYEHRIVMHQGNTHVNGPHQGAWVDTVTGEDWFIHFQDVYAAGRIVHLQPMTWVEDWPVIGKAGKDEVCGEPVAEWHKPDITASWKKCEPEDSCDFRTGKLGMQWQWNANPKPEWYEFCEEGIKLKAVGNEGIPYADLPNLLLQKWPAPQFSCVTKLKLDGLREGDAAGVISLGTRYGVLVFERVRDGIRVCFVEGKQHFGKILVETTEETRSDIAHIDVDTAGEIYVRYTVRQTGTQDLNGTEKGFPREKVSFEFSTDGMVYQPAGEMNAVPGRWVGVKSGIFCTRREQGTGGFVIAESVKYTAD